MVHEHDHLLRKLLNEQCGAFGVKGISVDRKTRSIVSSPYVYTNYQVEDDLTTKILNRMKAKSAINYPSGTVLVIQCFLERLFLEDEWERAIEQVRQAQLDHRFPEVFVCDSACG